MEIEKVRRENMRLENKVIPELERQLEDKKYEIYNSDVQIVMRHLDKTLAERQDELSRLSFINSQIEMNELGNLDKALIELMRIKAETQVLRK